MNFHVIVKFTSRGLIFVHKVSIFFSLPSHLVSFFKRCSMLDRTLESTLITFYWLPGRRPICSKPNNECPSRRYSSYSSLPCAQNQSVKHRYDSGIIFMAQLDTLDVIILAILSLGTVVYLTRGSFRGTKKDLYVNRYISTNNNKPAKTRNIIEKIVESNKRCVVFYGS
jgi:hypothetical protein